MYCFAKYYKPPLTDEFVSKLVVNKCKDSLLIFDDVENMTPDKDLNPYY